MDILTLMASGAAAGILAGLMGVGGGVIIVPVLFLVLADSASQAILIKVAVGTSLATIAVTAVSSTLAHHRRGSVEWGLVRRMAPGVMIGALLGAAIADQLPAFWMTVLFIAGMPAIALQMALGRGRKASRERPSTRELAGVSVGVGTLSALLGIGGGTLNVPYLSGSGVPMKTAIGTATAVGFPLAAASTLGFIFMGLDEAGLPPHSLGYINLPAVAGIVTAGVLFAPLGAKLAHVLPDRALRRGFAVFLLFLALRMAYGLFNP